MSRFTIKIRLIVSVVVLLAVSMGSLVTLLTMRSTSSQQEASFTYAEQLSQVAAQQVQAEVSQGMATARDLAQVLSSMAQRSPNRAAADLAQKQLLATHPNFLGVWSGWEPNAFDYQDAAYAGKLGTDATGRYIAYWHRNGDAITVDPLTDYEKPGAGDYYLIPRNSGQEKVLEPYIYQVSGKDVLMTSLAVPITVSGKVVGVAGVDMALSALQAKVDAIRPYGVGRATLVSTAGAVVAGKGKGVTVGKPLSGITATASSESAKANKASLQVADIAGTQQLLVATPVHLGSVDTWSLLVQIPTDVVLAPAHSLRTQAIVLTIVALLAAGLATLLMARGIVRPIEQLRDRMAEIADGEGDLTQRVAEDQTTEIGQ
ncbi:MAG: mcp3, partial [Frankiales bacterium]|nr:mcp3 [Frankiales bacterium]